jgi:VanZ family protein
MRVFLKPKIWLGIWLFGWLLCIALSLITPPNLGIDVDNSDKIGHFLAYGTLAAWAVMIFQQKRAWLLSAISLVCLGIVMEFMQGYFTSNRMMDWHDAVANTVGVGLGMCMGLLPINTALQKIDQRIFASA